MDELRAFTGHMALCADFDDARDAQRVYVSHSPLGPPDGHPERARYETARLIAHAAGYSPDWLLLSWAVVRDQLGVGPELEVVSHYDALDDEAASLCDLAPERETRPPPTTVILADTLARHAPPERALTPHIWEERAA